MSDHALAPLFTEHAAPQHAEIHAVHGMIDPLDTLNAAVRKQVIEYRSILAKAKRAGYPDGQLEHLRQTLASMESHCTQLEDALHGLTHDVAQWSGYVEGLKPAPTEAAT